MTTPEDSLSRDSQKHGRNAIQRHKRGQWESDIDVLGSHLRHTEVQWGGETRHITSRRTQQMPTTPNTSEDTTSRGEEGEIGR